MCQHFAHAQPLKHTVKSAMQLLHSSNFANAFEIFWASLLEMYTIIIASFVGKITQCHSEAGRETRSASSAGEIQSDKYISDKLGHDKKKKLATFTEWHGSALSISLNSTKHCISHAYLHNPFLNN